MLLLNPAIIAGVDDVKLPSHQCITVVAAGKSGPSTAALRAIQDANRVNDALQTLIGIAIFLFFFLSIYVI
jgi:hypothetical protein